MITQGEKIILMIFITYKEKTLPPKKKIYNCTSQSPLAEMSALWVRREPAAWSAERGMDIALGASTEHALVKNCSLPNQNDSSGAPFVTIQS